MKRKLALLLTLVLSVGILGGCGGNSETENSNNSNISGQNSSNSSAISEYLAEETAICYKVKSVDKAETPENIYFFKDGKLTIIPGKEFGLTMGDFAQMTDKEIWTELEKVKVSYAENYTYKSSNIEDEAYKQVWAERNYDSGIVEGLFEGEEYDTFRDCYDDLVDYETLEDEDIDNGTLIFIADFYLFDLLNGKSEGDLYEMGENIQTQYNNIMAQQGQDYENGVLVFKEFIKAVENKKRDLYNGPFFEQSFAFVVETDASGNNVQSESLIYPTLSETLTVDGLKKFYDKLEFAVGLTGQYEIYDSTYTGLATSGSGQFCMREALEFDTLDSKNILVDQTKDELNALFEAEINARYE